MNKFIFKKLLKTHVWKRILVERLTEPLHLNIISIFIALFGTFRMKVSFDLVVRQHTAYCLLKCADNFLRSYRIMKNPRWIDHVFTYHVVDHPSRTSINNSVKNINLDNPYLWQGMWIIISILKDFFSNARRG